MLWILLESMLDHGLYYYFDDECMRASKKRIENKILLKNLKFKFKFQEKLKQIVFY